MLPPPSRPIADEFERVERFGFTQSELDRAVGSRRSSVEQTFESRGSRQDVSFADEYVRHVLEDEWYVTADQEFAFNDAVLDAATPESVAGVFVERAGRRQACTHSSQCPTTNSISRERPRSLSQ